jgi:hypothetical protein
MRKSAGRLLFVVLIAMLAFPVVANAMYQFGDSPTVALRDGASAPSTASQPAPPSITVNRTSDNTLPTVLAAVSLGIALTGTTYVAFRLRSFPRT